MPNTKQSSTRVKEQGHRTTNVVLITTLFVVLGISALVSLNVPAGSGLRGMLEDPGADIASKFRTVAQVTSSADLQKAQESAKSARALQELYLQMVSSMINNPGSEGTNASFMSLMQQMISAQQKSSQDSAGPTPTDNARLLEQLMSSMQMQQNKSSLGAGNYTDLMKQILDKLSSSSAPVTSSAVSSSRSASSVASSKTSLSSVSRSTAAQASVQSLSSSLSEEEMRQLIQLLFMMMANQQSSKNSSPLSSAQSSAASVVKSSAILSSSKASAVPKASAPASKISSPSPSSVRPTPTTLEDFASSLQAVVQAVEVPLDPTLSKAVQDALQGMTQAQASLAKRLTTQLTLMPPMRTKIYEYILKDLAQTQLNPSAADEVFFGFKLENGSDLMSYGYVLNPDIDPKDWYAAPVAYVESKGLMKGQGSGLFVAEKSLNQAELAVILANVLKQRGGVLHSSAQAGQSFASWPIWGQEAVAELRGRGVNVTFFTAHALSPVTRLQIARAIIDTLFPGRQLTQLSAKRFGDTAKLPAAVQKYVTAVASLGIMTGNGTTGLFDPYAFVNRAEAAKIFAKAVDVSPTAH